MTDTAAEILRGRLAANLIAADARTARHRDAQCAVCLRPVYPGQRIADLASGRGIVHVADCAARAAQNRRKETP